MRLSVFKSVKDAWVFDTIDGDWSEMVNLLLEKDNAKEKDQVLMFNFCKFKSVEEGAEPGRSRKFEYDVETKKSEWTGEYNYYEGTIRRCGNNLVEIYGIVLDFDKNVTLEEAMTKYANYEYVIYTTWRHTLENHRFRMVIPFSRPLKAEDIELRKESIKEVFPDIDPASVSVSQSFYFHSGPEDSISYHNEGQFIDPYEMFEERERKVEFTGDRKPISDEQKERFIQLLCKIRLQDDVYHTWLMIGWAMNHGGFSLQDYQYVSSFMTREKTPQRCANVWNEGDGRITMGSLIKFLRKYYVDSEIFVNVENRRL